jgi:hypothetical protein
MKDLIDFQRYQIETLQKRVCELESQLNEVKQYCFELCEDAPEDYKTIIKQTIYELCKS